MPSARLEVYIQPRASRTELAGMHGGTIKIRIAAPPVDNAANHALIDFLARSLDVAKSRIRIISGSTSRKKVLEIDGITTEILTAKLGQQ